MNQASPMTSGWLPDWPGWLRHTLAPGNTDFNARAVLPAHQAHWVATDLAGVDIRVLEYVPAVQPTAQPRLSAQLRFRAEHTPASLGALPDVEILLQRGEFKSATDTYPAGMYYRLPADSERAIKQMQFESSASGSMTEPAAKLYIASGHMTASDIEARRIDTNDASRWLPGPVDGTEVLALHGHGTANVMLIHWSQAVDFKPNLDPRGEEILVLQGTLKDQWGQYPAGSWLRNPIVAWQSWGAEAGTIIYYKNGHFPER